MAYFDCKVHKQVFLKQPHRICPSSVIHINTSLFREGNARAESNTDYLNPDIIQRVAKDVGRQLPRRTTLYELV